MEHTHNKKDIINKLQQKVLSMQGFKTAIESTGVGLGAIEAAFPNGVFPKAAIHEFIIAQPEHAAACAGFLAGILKNIKDSNAVFLWISSSRKLFPAALKVYGVEPDQVIFIDLALEKDVLWVMEEALKCKEIAAVVAELKTLSFAQSRRLQLAIEKSKVCGFVLRTDANQVVTTACVARWRISPMVSEQLDGLPGLGFPCWNVELLRVRNGNPGSWKLTWMDGKFQLIDQAHMEYTAKLKTG